MTETVRPLSVLLQPAPAVPIVRIAEELARVIAGDRLVVSLVGDQLKVQCVWYGDLDRISPVCAGAMVWSEPEIEYRTQVVRDSAGRTREIVLEPLMRVEVVTCADFVGSVIGDLSARRGLVCGMVDNLDNTLTVAAEVPLQQLQGYPSALALMTRGTGSASVDFKEFVAAPPSFEPDPKDPAVAALRAA